MSASVRWSVVAMVIVVALGVALWTELGADERPSFLLIAAQR